MPSLLFDPSPTRDPRTASEHVRAILYALRGGEQVYVVANSFASWMLGDPALRGFDNLHVVYKKK